MRKGTLENWQIIRTNKTFQQDCQIQDKHKKSTAFLYNSNFQLKKKKKNPFVIATITMNTQESM